MTPFWLPAAASLVIGFVFVLMSESSPLMKLLGTATFAVAVYLQFFSAHWLTGLLLQCTLAFALALRLKLAR